jgi:DNA mismatch endonuclease (patch repair protein)
MRRPCASSDAALSRMRRQRHKDTGPELALRRELHLLGLRYRVHQKPVPTLRRTLDIVFGRAKVAVDVRGCFWHSCPRHATRPKANRDWWDAKLAANRERDADTELQLAERGWLLLVVWEHEDPSLAARRIAAVVSERR